MDIKCLCERERISKKKGCKKMYPEGYKIFYLIEGETYIFI